MAPPGLLAEIEADVLTDRPLADALRKCVILGGKAGSVELREWATHELRGYRGDDGVPDYRTVGAPILVDAFVGNGQVTGQRIGVWQLPDFVKDDVKESVMMPQGVGEIEAMIATADGAGRRSIHASLPMATELARLMDIASDNSFQHITDLYWSVSISALRGILDQVRTTLAELVGEMRAGMPTSDDVPSADVANQAVSVAVHGNKARVTVTTAQSAGDGAATVEPPSAPDTGFWTYGRRIGVFLVGLAAIVTCVLTYLLWLR